MIKKDFVNKRTKIITKMLDNPDELGIFSTTIAFAELDDIYDEMSQQGEVKSEAQILRDSNSTLRYCSKLNYKDMNLWKMTLSAFDCLESMRHNQHHFDLARTASEFHKILRDLKEAVQSRNND